MSKTIFAAIVITMLIWWAFRLSFITAIAVVLVLSGAMIGLIYWYADMRKRNDYSKRFENIYVVGEVNNESESDRLSHLKHLIEFVDNEYVEATAALNKEYLEKSGNNFYCDPDLTEKGKLQIKTIIYQDADFPNENYESYLNRIVKEIEEDRVYRHAILKKANPTWYAIYGNKQKGQF